MLNLVQDRIIKIPVQGSREQIRTRYYRWKANFARHGVEGFQDRSPFKGRTWNELLPHEEKRILEVAELYPERFSREISVHITDNEDFSVSESTVYHVFKRNDLMRISERKTFPAGPDYTVRTKRANEMWRTDPSHLIVKN